MAEKTAVPVDVLGKVRFGDASWHQGFELFSGEGLDVTGWRRRCSVPRWLWFLLLAILLFVLNNAAWIAFFYRFVNSIHSRATPRLPWRELSTEGIDIFRGKSKRPFRELPASELKRNWRWLLPPARSERIIWIHIHNYGGTTICDLASMQGERITFQNCLFPGDGCMGTRTRRSAPSVPRKFAGCEERAAAETITFSMIERGLVAADLGCHGVLTGIQLREPVSGAQAILQHEHYSTRIDTIFFMIEHKIDPRFDATNNAGLQRKDVVGFVFFDNFAVRILSGKWMNSPGKMNREDLDMAKKVLSRIDAVLILEELDKHMVQLEKLFRWTTLPKPIFRSNRHKAGAMGMSEEQLQRFIRINTLDLELYDFGRQLAANRTAYFSK